VTAAAPFRRDIAVATLLALTMGAVWAMRHWSELAALALPDTDDLMRLQQVRGWLAGQAFGDLHQYRLGGPGGTLMHWSRLPDMPIAALILLAQPILGPTNAELFAVVAWPTALFALYLTLVAAVARRLNVAPVPAIIVAALAYPTTTLFAPGRIDHHGLQVVLLLACLHGMVAPPARWRGVAIGAAMVASAAIGFEMLGSLAVIGAWAAVSWYRGEHALFEGMSAALLLVGTAAFGLIPLGAPAGTCDALAYPTASLLVAGGAIGLAMTLVARGGVSRRIALAGGVLGAGIAAALLAGSCRSGPYGAVDPTVARLWLANVSEAQSILTAPLTDIVGYLGLAIVGLAATIWQMRRQGGAWAGLAALIAIALIVAAWQLRGAYAGVALAPFALAQLIAAARARGALPLAGAWLVSAGTLYPIAASAAAPAPLPAHDSCDTAAVIAALRPLPPGRVAAPMDLAPAIVTHTRHTSLGGPYHRNNRGNAALYRILLGPPATTRTTAEASQVDYIVRCPEPGSPPRIMRTARDRSAGDRG
jgi:hypothetical protein